MSTRFLQFVFPFFAAGTIAGAATLPNAVSLHLRPDVDSPRIGTIPAGQSVTPMIRDEFTEEGLGELPSGWLAMRHSGPYFGYVHKSEMGKDLTAKPGARIRAAPANDAPEILRIEKGTRADAVDLEGDWSKVVFREPLVVYFNTLPEATSSEATEPPQPAESTPTPATAPAAQPPISSAAETGAEEVRDANKSVPRTFRGYLTTTRRFLGRGPTIKYQLVDENNNRIALLDLSALLLTDPLDRLESRLVDVYGPGINVEGVKEPVIRVETLRLAN